MDPKIMGQRVRALRHEQGLTTTRLGAMVGTTASYISGLERGEIANPGINTLTAIADVLGVRLAYIQGIDMERTPGYDTVLRSVFSQLPVEVPIVAEPASLLVDSGTWARVGTAYLDPADRSRVGQLAGWVAESPAFPPDINPGEQVIAELRRPPSQGAICAFVTANGVQYGRRLGNQYQLASGTMVAHDDAQLIGVIIQVQAVRRLDRPISFNGEAKAK